jgi:hypothetical protein
VFSSGTARKFGFSEIRPISLTAERLPVLPGDRINKIVIVLGHHNALKPL